jgi:hypothetical protein
MNNYNVLYNNKTGQVVFQNKLCNKSSNQYRSISPFKNITPVKPLNINSCLKNFNNSNNSNKDNEFYKKLEDLNKLSGLSVTNTLPKYTYYDNNDDINNTRNMFLNSPSSQSSSLLSSSFQNSNKIDVEKKGINNDIINNILNNKLNNDVIKNNDAINNMLNNNILLKKDLTYGIKKTILSDFNYLYSSSNSNDFKIGLNQNNNQLNTIFDVFYLFPNISEVNTKTETNIINEKKIEFFENIYSKDDKQYFPLDFIPCGITIPLKTNTENYKKIVIKNIFWNIFQSIDSSNYKTNELLSIIPDKNDFKYTPLSLQINFELHAQISNNFLKYTNNKILPYRNNLKCSNPANSCLFEVKHFNIENLNGSNFDNIVINIPDDLSIDCAILCIRISVPDSFIPLLKGTDKYNKLFFGFIPFSQFILNFDYELSL